MADWTANSGFGVLGGRREPLVRLTRPEAPPRNEAPRAERFAPIRDLDHEEEEAAAGAAAALAQYNAAQGGPLAKARLAVWIAGGVCSLALLAGIGVWGYKIVLREVLGLPVVAAEAGPMRIVPADPGGEIVPEQGLAVNAIPAAGVAAPPSDVLLLAPPTLGLAEEDLDVVVQTRAEAGEVAPAVATPQGTSGIVPTDRPMTYEEMLAFADTVARDAPPLAPPAEAAPAVAAAPEVAGPPAAPAEAAPLEAAPVEVAAAVADPAATPEAAPAVVILPADVPGVAAAIRPLARPAATVQLVTGAAPAAPASEAVAAPEPAAPETVATATPEPVAEAATSVALTQDIPVGTSLVQLGAFDSPEIAASEWTRLQGRFGDFLGSRERVVQPTESGGRTFYRLRATGFTDLADARRLCAALTAEGADCLPLTVN